MVGRARSALQYFQNWSSVLGAFGCNLLAQAVGWRRPSQNARAGHAVGEFGQGSALVGIQRADVVIELVAQLVDLHVLLAGKQVREPSVLKRVDGMV